MAKRFTDTEKFTDPWFRRLNTQNKLLWDWMLCSCDHAGFISIDMEFIELILGEKYPDDVIEKHFSERVLKLGNFKYFIPKFIKFQYGELRHDSRVHKSVFRKLLDHGINYETLDVTHVNADSLSVNADSVKDKEKDKDKDSSFSFSSLKEECVKIDNVIQLFNDKCAGKGKISFCRGLSSRNIQDFIVTTSFKDFKIINTWQEIFQKTVESEFLTGQQADSSFVATLNWLVIHDNALKVLNGQYNGSLNEQKGTKSAFKSKSHGVASTPENPTGNPYLEEARQKGYIA